MTTEHTITIHHEPPPLVHPHRHIMAYDRKKEAWVSVAFYWASVEWGERYTAWYDPQLGEPVKPRRYVVEEFGGMWRVRNVFRDTTPAISIPTREAAQRIADIYEEVKP